ncbi:type II toxin-antitoxin system Phd/YefM family antitoxin [Nocardia caishijiensis]|uniref:Antitoxin n=1 Tax=Nocardia caishijiensis TaxID=184756 RepID=A0ABQ6YTB2_9NOCA|nr:type II toxin-antitoxin system prevent-host-death family antitoxin [Nocardia caishijiensis]KAF0848656.1 antitoxin YefM [Nocardia caishijiensis]
MQAMHQSSARENFTAVLDAATEDNDEVIITRSGGKGSAVVISLAEYNALKETAYLLDNPANAAWLAKGIEQDRAGMAVARELIEVDATEDVEE